MSHLSGTKAATAPEVTAAQSAAEAAQATANKIVATVPGLISLLDTSAARYVHVGDSATIDSVQIVIDGSTTAASTVTIAVTIDGVAVTDGDITIEAANTGDDTVFGSTPSAANTVVAGEVVKFVVSTAGNAVDVKGAITLAMTRV